MARGKAKRAAAKRPGPKSQSGGRRRAPERGSRAIETALASFAHDVRTPLTGIIALGELLATSELGERERRWVAALKSAAEQIAALTTVVVDAVRADTKGLVLRRERFDARALAETAAASLMARAEAKGLTCASAIDADVPERVIGDQVRLRAALENLLDNAVKFTERGEVALKVSARASRDRVRLVFAVSDSGIGMTPAEMKRLFRPFAQASKQVALSYGGAGLGLMLVKRLAEAMGGGLAAESTPGRGSTFRLTVVVGKDKTAGAAASDAPGAKAADRPAAPVKGLNILCAEDNPYGRVILRTILTELGHSADFAGSGEAAVEAASRGGYDAVLMDITLPGIDGLEATRRIRALPLPASRLSVIGISGRSSAEEEAAARAAGMDGYLAKPIGPSALARALKPSSRD